MQAKILLNFNIKNYKPIIENLVVSAKSNNSIYSGKSGIIIYLLELYEITKDTSLLIEVENLAQIIYDETKNKEISSYAFFTGDMGISYMFLKLFQLTNKKQYLEYSTHIAKKSKIQLGTQKKPIIDLINGVSGTLLGLLHLHEAGINEDWLIEDIKFYTDYIIAKSELGNKGGIFWDRTNKINKGLTGFSHGASGIGFVFYELYKLSGIEGFKHLCLQSFVYEDNHYDEIKKNWLDFRMSPFTEIETQEFDFETQKENIDFYTKPKFMNAWCHGAPGILLSRHNAKFSSPKTKNAIAEVVESLKRLTNHSLCHSGVGNALCLMSVFDEVDNDLNEELIALCKTLIGYFNHHKEFISGYNDKSYNKSLIMGDLGILYFMLKVYKYFEEEKIDQNILYPILSNTTQTSNLLASVFSNYDCNYVSKEILKNHYPKTIFLLEQKSININYSKTAQEQDFIETINKLEDHLILDAFEFERTTRDTLISTESFSFNYYRNKIDLDLLTKHTTVIEELSIFTNPRLKTIQTSWNWDSYTNPKWTLNSTLAPQESSFLLIPNWEITTIKSNNFQLMLLEHLNNSSSVKINDVINLFINTISIEEHQKKETEQLILNNIISLIKLGAINILHD